MFTFSSIATADIMKILLNEDNNLYIAIVAVSFTNYALQVKCFCSGNFGDDKKKEKDFVSLKNFLI